MIISASRRTDIPAFYSDWFINRLNAGFLDVKNPMNTHQVSRIPLTPDIAECIVFWTKDPSPMLARLKEIDAWKYYFQFTLTSYDQTIEPKVRKKSELIQTFTQLSDKIGPDSVIWRYDPIFLTNHFSVDYHKKWFEEIAKKLSGKTRRCVVSILDQYKKTERNLSGIQIQIPSQEQSMFLLRYFAEVAATYGIEVQTCSEAVDYSSCNVCPGKCIDDELISKIAKMPIDIEKDKTQRKECGCVSSIDVGTYNTCLHGCKYCYANFSEEKVSTSRNIYDPDSTMLCDKPSSSQVINNRVVHQILEEPKLDDKAFVPSVKAQNFGGMWTQQKLEILNKYLAFFTNALKYKIKDLVYIDGFAGSGASVKKKIADTPLFSEGEQADADNFLRGSAHIALDLPIPFHRYFLIESEEENVLSLQVLASDFPDRDLKIIHGEANEKVQKICREELKPYSRGVIFLDPFATEVKWETLKCIAESKKLDLWLLFPFNATIRLLKKDGNISEAWAKILTNLFGSEDWKTDLLKSRTVIDLFGETREVKERADSDQIGEYVIKRLNTIFNDGVAKKPVYLKNSKNSTLFMLCFAVSNPDPKARGLALRVANDIIGKGFS